MTVTNAIRAELEKHLSTTTPALPAIAWGNIKFDQTAVTQYIQTQFAPMMRRPATRGPDPQYRHSGVFLLTVCVEEETGAGAGLVLVDRLLGRFRVDTAILGVDVNVRIDYSEPEMPYQRPPFYCLPVRVGWYCYANA